MATQSIFSNRRMFLRWPFWRSYLVAYLLIGMGFLQGDTGPSRSRLVEVVGGTMFCAGLLVFAVAIGFSIWFVAGGKPPRNGAT